MTVTREKNRKVDKERAEQIITAILQGAASAQSVATTIEKSKLNISPAWFYKRLAQDEALQDRWVTAKLAGAHIALDHVDDLLAELLAMMRADVLIEDKNGELRRPRPLTQAKINAIRAAIDHAKWTAARLLPKLYAGKVKLEGGGLGGSVTMTIDLGEQGAVSPEDGGEP